MAIKESGGKYVVSAKGGKIVQGKHATKAAAQAQEAAVMVSENSRMAKKLGSKSKGK